VVVVWGCCLVGPLGHRRGQCWPTANPSCAAERAPVGEEVVCR
jgi:hypothetical protein